MKKRNGSSLFKLIIAILASVVAVAALAFVFYVKFQPEYVEIKIKDYTNIEQEIYNVDENELNGEWLDKIEYAFDLKDLKKYEDLREYYSGRDNPFALENNEREKIIFSSTDLSEFLEETGNAPEESETPIE